MSIAGKKVLHMDRNSYYGGESASLNLQQLYQKFNRDENKIPEGMGRVHSYCVDLCPKFLMACGNLVKVLLHTKVTRYLEFRSVQGSFVLKDGKVHKVPATPSEALASGLMGMFQKRRFKNFITYAGKYEASDVKTHEGHDLTQMTTSEMYKAYKLDDNTQTFTSHALALYLNDEHLNAPAYEAMERIKMYAYSVSRYGNSPYIYPLWGLGGLPEGFSRLCAINGGVYMLNKPIEEILYDDNGNVRGVKSEGEEAYCKQLISDPSYFVGTDKIKTTGQIARCICIMSHPVPGTNDVDSCQIILPSRQIQGRESDMYICCVSYFHKIAADGKYIAVVSASVEGKQVEPYAGSGDQAEDVKMAQQYLGPALKILGQVDQLFFWITDYNEPADNGDAKSGNNCFISKSYDATTHFESATDEVLSMYTAITGEVLDMTITAEPDDLKDDGM
jgi:Rab GDP dissociation inhibitor